jgi:two-component system OmpR family response regulator
MRSIPITQILLIEREQEVARALTLALQAKRFVVDCAPDLNTGLSMVPGNQYGLLIIDLASAEASGAEVIRQVRQQYAETPILALIEKDAPHNVLEILESGADDCITKPCPLVELFARIEAVLWRNIRSRSTVIAIGDLKINRSVHQVQRGSQVIGLTPTEYVILEYLATSAGRVVSRTMIAEHVWGKIIDGLTNIVEVYIRSLKLKLDKPFGRELIHTSRYVGYSLSACDDPSNPHSWGLSVRPSWNNPSARGVSLSKKVRVPLKP